jgi:hypothetical protein
LGGKESGIFLREGLDQVFADLPDRLICRRTLPEIVLAQQANQFAAREIPMGD